MSEGRHPVPSSFEIWQRAALPEEIAVLDIFRYPKDPAYPEQYEDASGFRLFQQSKRDKTLALALADGASEAILSKDWSRILVESYVDRHPRRRKSGLRPDWWQRAQARFKSDLDVTSLPWYAIEKLGSGSSATFGGLAVYWTDRQFSIAGYGDVLIVLVSQNGLTIYPESLRDAGAFGNRPNLVGTLSSPPDEGRIQNRKTLPHGDCTFLLMTDALGAWFVAENERNPTGAVAQLKALNEINFESFIQSNWSNKTMRIDDVTLMRLHLA